MILSNEKRLFNKLTSNRSEETGMSDTSVIGRCGLYFLVGNISQALIYFLPVDT